MGRNPYNVKETILKNLQRTAPTKFWKAKGPNAMEVDRTGTANTAQETEAVKANATQRKPLTDEQRQALRTLGACFYCRNTGHLA